MQDTVNAFIDTFTVEGAADGPLAGLTFGAKDLYDVAGHVTGCGSPDWARTHEPAAANAPAVQALLDAGATLVGKTHTDEIAYSLLGMNAHYGTPMNIKAPTRVPGGSSSGSVAATAAGLIDVGLGSDTGGSVRIPASFCGVYGLRSTHGRIDISGAMPLAHTFDTVGWFARDAQTFAKAGAAFGMDAPAPSGVRLMIAEDAVDLADPETWRALEGTVADLAGVVGSIGMVTLSGDKFDKWFDVFRVCQAAEVWENHAEWVTATNPSFGPGVRERFEMASKLDPADIAQKRAERAEIKAHLIEMIGDDGIVVLPTSPSPAPLIDSDQASLETFRAAALQLLCAAGLAGLPQLNIPAGEVDGAPVGLSILGGPNADDRLIGLAVALSQAQAAKIC